MSKNYICAMCGNVVNEDNIEAMVVCDGELIICKTCNDNYDDETPIYCNFDKCPNCNEFVLFTDNECKYCGCKYNRDFVERMEWITDNLDRDGMLFYSEDSHDYYTCGCSDTCFFEEDIDYILDYLKENYQKRKGLYKIIWFDNTVGIVVGAKNVKKFIVNLRESYREDDEGEFEALTYQIEKEKEKLIDMYVRHEEDSLITKQERYIKELVEQQKDYWKACENDFKLFVYTEKIR